ncbi:transposase [Thioalkalivibrio sulfidiphilus]|uniref:transposase n=1 Tax=Thioalkalivibrio sulfidiphilus TaxID=1033854 RepID=UPI003B2D8B59
MARPLRIEYPGAWYHVMNRGAGRRTVFNTDAERMYFLSLLADTHARFNAEWHAYCLMGNHYHLLLRTPEANMQRIMRHVNGVYTQYFNRCEDLDGPLFRGRYKAVLVDAQSHWLELSRYIHRNPLQAGLVDDLADYPWSSYRAYVGLDPTPDWLQTGYVLGAIGKRRVHARYRAYMEGDSGEALCRFYDGRGPSSILGDEAFRRQALEGRMPSVDVPEVARNRPRPTLDDAVRVTCEVFGVDEQEIWTSRRGRGVGSPARSVVMYVCQEACGMTLSEIAVAFGLASYASAGSAVRALRRRMVEDESLRERVNMIILDLTPA